MVNRRRGRHVHQVQQNVQEDEVVDPRSLARQFAEAMVEAVRTIQAPGARGTSVVMESMCEFRAMNPPSFDGMGESLEADHWLSGIRKVLVTLQIREDEMRASFASYQLVGEASEWWNSVIESKKDARRLARVMNPEAVEDNSVLVSWDQFITDFEN